ncbi:hypothetical protein ALNOE001_17740 [Candidatus Methanobinarius endosymbioticus]|uniref:Right handed beta helix domain-containing protein n=1 Tax=Candidatus Methanobinarius endosymbioticus TaxID=2006182 RepID=A0A366M8N3_9EURY|nr:hypothetical protein ALNOE001_17740 [Candidatus Methanobinarius endosymbioticus]
MFNVKSSHVNFINLTISGYASAFSNSSSSSNINNIRIAGNKINTTGITIGFYFKQSLNNFVLENNIINSDYSAIWLNAGRGVINGNNQNIHIRNNIINCSISTYSETIQLSTEYGFNSNVYVINNTLIAYGQTIYLGSGAFRSDFGRNENITISNNYINCTNGARIHLNPFNEINKNININNNCLTGLREGIFVGYGNAQNISIINNNINSLSNS